MRDMLLQTSGVLAIAAAIVHGILAETKVFATATVEPPSMRLLLRLVWQCSTIAWIGLGVLLVAAPYLASPSARSWIIAVGVAVFGFGALGNAWATRGRHFGWMILAAVVGMALAGL